MPRIIYKNHLGESLKGVTTITGDNAGWNKRPLQYHSAEMARLYPDLPIHEAMYKKRDEAAEAGTVCHAMIDANIKEIEFDLSQYPTATVPIIAQARTGYKNYLEWREMVNLRPIATEISMVSELWQFGGTPDCIGTVIDKLSVIDWKSSKDVYPEMLLQLGAYAHLWLENNPNQPLDGGFHLLRVARDSASFAHYHWGPKELDPAWEAFKHCLELDKLHKVLNKLK